MTDKSRAVKTSTSHLHFLTMPVNATVHVAFNSPPKEKTKIVAKLAPKNAGAPVREPRIDENTHKACPASPK